MRKVRIDAGLILFGLAAVVGGLAWITEALLNSLALWVVAAFLAWKGVMALVGRAESSQPVVVRAADFRLFLRRILAVFLLVILAPLTVVSAVWGLLLLSQGSVLAGGAAVLAAGGLGWCCWGLPLRKLWGTGRAA